MKHLVLAALGFIPHAAHQNKWCRLNKWNKWCREQMVSVHFSGRPGSRKNEPTPFIDTIYLVKRDDTLSGSV
jgi:hypothetical protein